MVAVLFSRESSQARDQTQAPHIASEFFGVWASREAQEDWSGCLFSGDLPNPGSPALQAESLPIELQGEPYILLGVTRYTKQSPKEQVLNNIQKKSYKMHQKVGIKKKNKFLKANKVEVWIRRNITTRY